MKFIGKILNSDQKFVYEVPDDVHLHVNVVGMSGEATLINCLFYRTRVVRMYWNGITNIPDAFADNAHYPYNILRGHSQSIIFGLAREQSHWSCFLAPKRHVTDTNFTIYLTIDFRSVASPSKSELP